MLYKSTPLSAEFWVSQHRQQLLLGCWDIRCEQSLFFFFFNTHQKDQRIITAVGNLFAEIRLIKKNHKHSCIIMFYFTSSMSLLKFLFNLPSHPLHYIPCLHVLSLRFWLMRLPPPYFILCLTISSLQAFFQVSVTEAGLTNLFNLIDL